MEVSGVVSRQLPSFTGAGERFSGKTRQLGFQETRIALKPRKFSGLLTSGFSDEGHLRYYNGPAVAVAASLSATKCGGGKKEQVKDVVAKKMKKRLKLLKGLKKDLSMFSEMGFGLNPDHDLADQVKEKMISEATDLLIQQLQQLKAEEKELKRKKKEEKAKLKANCELSSSDSSDSECDQVIDMNQLKPKAASSTTVTLQPVDQEPTQLVNQSVNLTEPVSVQIHPAEESVSSDAVQSCAFKKIEVCMGGKCKKSGAANLLEEFQNRVGSEGSVVGCKCMGKCRDGPNVRVLNNAVEAQGVDGSVTAPANPLCIGVGLADVSLILENFFSGNAKDLNLVGA
jgi:hypothetical protein